MSVTAFDSGVRVVVEVDENPSSPHPIALTIGEEDAIHLSEREAQRIIEGLAAGLARHQRGSSNPL